MEATATTVTTTSSTVITVNSPNTVICDHTSNTTTIAMTTVTTVINLLELRLVLIAGSEDDLELLAFLLHLGVESREDGSEGFAWWAPGGGDVVSTPKLYVCSRVSYSKTGGRLS